MHVKNVVRLLAGFSGEEEQSSEKDRRVSAGEVCTEPLGGGLRLGGRGGRVDGEERRSGWRL